MCSYEMSQCILYAKPYLLYSIFQPHYDPGVDSASLTEISTRNLPGGKERPAHTADNLTAICEPTV
jgi:hypothetical protein